MKPETVEEIKSFKEQIEKIARRMMELHDEEKKTGKNHHSIEHTMSMARMENAILRLIVLSEDFRVIEHFNKPTHES